MLIRKLETEKERSKNSQPMERNQIVAVRDRILDKIKEAENNGGIETDKVIMDLRDVSPSIIHQEIKKLLEEGIIFEPQPGKIRWLG